MHALIHCRAAGEQAGLPENALLVTSLHESSPFLMINVSLGDQAETGTRDCGCLHQRLGLTTHVSAIRSFEKLTGVGVTFLGTDVIRILEEVLPAKFGGAPTQYQLVEDEDGQPLMLLLAHPDVGALNESEVAEGFLGALAATSPGCRVMAQRWRDSGTVRVVRRTPERTRAGKMQYLHTGPRGR